MAHTQAHPALLIAADESGFMAGVALFSGLLSEVRSRAQGDESLANSMNLDRNYRPGQYLSEFALPFLLRASVELELSRGFAAALGDYLGAVAEGSIPSDEFYTRLRFEDCAGLLRSEEGEATGPGSNVVEMFGQQVEG